MGRVTSFKELVGNTTTIAMIKNSLRKGKFPETVLFSGTMGTGKSTSAILAGMYLTCENPNEDGPCMECKTCKENLEALDVTGRGRNLVKINIGLLVKDKKNFENLIKEIFVLDQGEGNSVYILEEMHAMDNSDQTALLEEVDRKAPGTYIIMCTTQPNRVIPELRSRAIKFNFSRLRVGESRLLLEETCYKLGINKLNSNVADIIIKTSRGVPRDIINLVEFIHNNQPTLEQVQEFLGQVSADVLCSLLEAGSQSIYVMSQELSGLMLQFTTDVIIAQLKEFLVSAVFSTAGKTDELPVDIRKRLSAIGDDKMFFAVADLVSGLDSNSSEADLKFTMIKVSLLLQKRKVGSIYTENSKQTSEQVVEASNNSKEMENISKSKTLNGVKPLDLTAFDNF